ncbi:hypothetical protein N7492_009796 [Penicillium capsulatum]|uniref:CFEM domain-containing protein n=1 Tax=Penicillium capsulatum TaxID=69766 RepID=A0A9W9HN25_9EURO|nr:hypothetical protein N7492_009796 [Penicillium capsulatum]KAJ6114123.1 hypothetical protein N7512_007568 [Penicillium capsulatum]
MRLSIVCLVAYTLLLPLLVLGNTTGLPTCASDCLNPAIAGSSCSPDDTTCICNDAPLQQNATQCVLTQCMPKDQLTSKKNMDYMCHVPVRDKTQTNTIIAIIFVIPAVISSAIRISQFSELSGFEDGFMVMALISAILVGVLEIPIDSLGFGKDIWHVPLSNITGILKMSYIIQLFYVTSISSYKMSFLCLYLRIFPNPGLRKALYALMTLVALYFISFIFLAAFHCIPVSFTWTGWTGETKGSCLDFNAIAIACASINIAIDVAILALPLRQLAGLNLKPIKKILVLMMFSTGSLVLVVSIIRLKTLVAFGSSTNPTWDNVETGVWSSLECFIAVICINIPAVRRLILKTLARFGVGSYNRDTEPSNSHSYRKRQPPATNSFIMKPVPANVDHEALHRHDSHRGLIHDERSIDSSSRC